VWNRAIFCLKKSPCNLVASFSLSFQLLSIGQSFKRDINTFTYPLLPHSHIINSSKQQPPPPTNTVLFADTSSQQHSSSLRLLMWVESPPGKRSCCCSCYCSCCCHCCCCCCCCYLPGSISLVLSSTLGLPRYVFLDTSVFRLFSVGLSACFPFANCPIFHPFSA